MRFKFSIITIILLGLSVNVFAQNSSDEVKKILVEALSFSEQASYCANVKNILGFKAQDQTSSATLYRKVKNGEVFLRAEIPTKLTNVIIIITPEGRYQFSTDGGDIGRMNYTTSAQEPAYNVQMRYGSLKNVEEVTANKLITFSIDGETDFNGVACRKITARFPVDDESLSQIFKMSVEDIKNNRTRIEKSSPLVIEFLVGKDKPFIYSTVFYNLSGLKLLEKSLDQVTLIANIDDSKFEIPKKRHIKDIHNHEEWNALTERVVPENTETPEIRTLIYWVGKIIIALIVLVVIFVTIKKIKATMRKS